MTYHDTDASDQHDFSVRGAFSRLESAFVDQPVWSFSSYSRVNARLGYFWDQTGPRVALPVRADEGVEESRISEKLFLKKSEYSHVMADELADVEWFDFYPDDGEWDLDLFCSLVQSLLPEIASTSDLVGTLVEKVVEWSEMLSLMGKANSDKFKIQGLWGELAYLRHLIFTEGEQAVDSWRGPDAGRHDFEFGDKSLEVKTSSTIAVFRAKINGLAQLQPSLGKPLTVGLVRVDWDPDGESAKDLMISIIGLMSAHKAQDFKNKIDSLGVPKWNQRELEELRFAIHDVFEFPVVGNFPRITASVLGDSVDVSRIFSVEYEISLPVDGAIAIELASSRPA